jgi:RNA polymerase sigma-70 factor (ECF subfamily)
MIAGALFMIQNQEETREDFVMRLFEAYYNRVYAFTRKCAPQDVAEDVTQEVFVRLLQHPRLGELDLSVSYLIKVAHNLLRRRHARSTRLRELLETAVRDDIIQRHGRPGMKSRTPVEDKKQDLQIDEALQQLSNDERDAIRLIVQDGKSYTHAAEALGVTVTTINNWKHRGLSKLKKMTEIEAIMHKTNTAIG